MSMVFSSAKPVVSLEFILRVLRVTAFDHCDDIWWRTDNDKGGDPWPAPRDYSPVTFFVNCNDLFYWASADCEEVTEDNIALLEQTYAECEELEKNKPAEETKHASLYAEHLFCARSRKMRPQGACYKYYPEALKPLFDACGPEREVDRVVNPEA